MKLTRILSLSLAVAMFSMLSCATGEYAYDTWDADEDNYLNDNEFETAWNEVGYYDTWDTDDDSYLTEEEWNTGVNDYFDDYDTMDYGVFSDWDTDADGRLDDDEFGEGLYGVVDENDNDIIEENEYDTWYDDDFGV